MTAPLPSRRNFLGFATVLPAGLALGGPVVASATLTPDSPIKSLFRRYMAASQRVRAARSLLDPNENERTRFPEEERTMDEAKRALAAEPITSMEDLALVLWTVGHLPGAEWQLSERCRDFFTQEMDQ